MSRRFAQVLVVLATVALAACNSTPTAPAISDPKEILSKSIVALQEAKTVDITGDVNGTVDPSILGSGAAGGFTGGITLKGTKLDASADLKARSAKLHITFPVLFTTDLDLIVVSDAAYLKVTGPLASMIAGNAGDNYRRIAVPAAASGATTGSFDPAQAIDGLKAKLDELKVPPTKGANERCGDQDCYHVTLTLSDADAAGLGSAAPSMLAGLPFGVTLDVWSRTNDLRPAKLTIKGASGEKVDLTVTLNLAYDKDLTISAPPADQIAP